MLLLHSLNILHQCGPTYLTRSCHATPHYSEYHFRLQMVSLPQLPLLSHTALPFAHFEYSFAKTVTKTESSSDLLYPDLFWYQTSRFFLTTSFVTPRFVSGNSLKKEKKPHRNKVLLSLATSGCFQSTCVLAREALGAYSSLGPSCITAEWSTAAGRYGEQQNHRAQASTQSSHGLMQEI